MISTPYTYQIQGVRALHRMRGRAILGDEMGLGKSIQALMFAERHPRDRPVLIVCPASLKYNWQSECRKHFGWPAAIAEGMQPPEVGSATHAITIANYDILAPVTKSYQSGKTINLEGWLAYLKSLNAQLVILDEIHYLGNPDTLRSRAVRQLCLGVPHILGLSGTPLTNRPAELWPVLNILDPKQFANRYSYYHAHCGPRKTYWGWDFRGASNLPLLHQKLSTLMIRRRKADVLAELPAKQRFVVPLEISDRAQYTHAVTDFLEWLAQHDPVKVSAALRAQQLVRLGYLKRLAAWLKMQSVCGWIDSFLAESEGKLVVFAIHKKIIKLLSHRYHNACVVVDGSLTAKQRQLAVEQFQTQGRTRLFIGQLKAAGVGLTLTAASTVAFAEIDWVPGNHVQAEDRIHRISQKNTASIYYLIANETLESYLLEIIQVKQETINQVLDGNGQGDSLDVHSQLLQRMRKEPT